MRVFLLAFIFTLSGCQQDASQGTSQSGSPTVSPPKETLLFTYDILDEAGNALRLSDEEARQLTTQLKQRLAPSEENNIDLNVRKTSRLDISLPKSFPKGRQEQLKGLLSQRGHLEFRVLANPTAHPLLLKALGQAANQQSGLIVHGQSDGANVELGRWAQVAREPANEAGHRAYRYVPRNDVVRNAETGDLVSLDGFHPETHQPGLELAQFLEGNQITDLQILVVTGDNCHLTGSMISSATSLASDGESAIDIRFTPAGVAELAKLTGKHKPNPELGTFCKMAVLLDNQVLTAPRIMEALSTNRALISGTFNAAEAEELATILRSGSLPKGLFLKFRNQQIVSPR